MIVLIAASKRRQFWWWLLIAAVATGLLSRSVHTGFRLFDKYLGDALYAAMVYIFLKLTGRVKRVTPWTVMFMTAIELFQLTGIAAGLLRSQYVFARLFARLLGTEFSVFDLLSYMVGIACVSVVDRCGAERDSK